MERDMYNRTLVIAVILFSSLWALSTLASTSREVGTPVLKAIGPLDYGREELPNLNNSQKYIHSQWISPSRFTLSRR
jgi:hypothetical protein